ncbi:hypothetical protein [Oceanobacillus halophilus]|uniref:Uncharacterized protein n=1 Tax=Oceanobacillus halophilus TaxID=930130 RepID=A0A494ZXG4_9BACI|nr:hypothetical protein [Oceanobacillus halophilus]RKQ31390.1 hypothetical protein D8M06_14130 [Oceanobacillus halophilus]
MGRQIKGLLYFFLTNIRYSVMIFWSILFGFLILSISFSYFLLGVEDGEFYFGFGFAIYFYVAVLGFMVVKDNIPFSIKMGATRRNIFVGIGLYCLVIAVAKALIGNTLQSLTLAFTEATGITTFHFLHLSSFLEDTWLNRVVIDISIMFFLFAVMFLFGLLFYKTGLAGGGVVVGILLIALLLGIAKGWVADFFTELFTDVNLVFFLQLFGVSLVLYGVSYFLLRRITIIKAK